MDLQKLLILGATGTIGVNTLDVVARHPDRFQVYGLAAGKNIELLYAQACAHRPKALIICDADALSQWHALGFSEKLREQLGYIPDIGGQGDLESLCQSEQVDIVVAAIVGSAGLKPTLSALQAGKRVLLANKESLVLAGQFMIQACLRSGATILPVDSEHNAIFQCLPAGSGSLARGGVERILLTASGGPFLHAAPEELQAVTPEQACKHPNWSMGRKISVDSATLMNKGLEFIEACWLFSARPDQIEVVVHPQSIIHSLVQYVDGSTLAQLGNPDMRTPIAHALAWPERMDAGVPRLDLTRHTLAFHAPDEARFPCLRLAREAMQAGGTAPAVLNAANEVAVAAFLERKIPFTAIPKVIERVLTQLPMSPAANLDTILRADQDARNAALASLPLCLA